ncbi:MAG: hypothetical protein FWG84_02395 [Bacteroidales bacterium]|nr:hypothetical protein [Bacteroidales bacterium]
MRHIDVTQEALIAAIEAMALSKSIRDILMTEEQRKQLPELHKKHTMDIIEQIFQNHELPYEEFLSRISPYPPSLPPDIT